MNLPSPSLFVLPTKPKIQMVDAEVDHLRGSRRFRDKNPQPVRVSESPPHTQFSVIPSRAITDPRINFRKPMLLLLGAIGIHAVVLRPKLTHLAG